MASILIMKSFIQFTLLMLFQLRHLAYNAHGLKVGYYKETCPNAETLVRNTVADYIAADPTVSAPVLRLHFHDCFVRGCDGSVLLNSTKTNIAEKDANPNHSLDGFYVIDAAKAALEKACPGTVSCADILALAARDAVSLVTGSVFQGNWTERHNLWEVETGRRDGIVSLATEALENLPSGYDNITKLKATFGSKGLTPKDLAVLSGAHTIGNSHCSSFDRRLYNFTGKGDTDPSLDPKYAEKLRSQCKQGDTVSTVEMIPGSATTFDTKYYQTVIIRRGVLFSDEALLQDKETRKYAHSKFNSHSSKFFFDFGVSMVKMGRAGVITGNAGEIRSNCALVNRLKPPL